MKTGRRPVLFIATMILALMLRFWHSQGTYLRRFLLIFLGVSSLDRTNISKVKFEFFRFLPPTEICKSENFFIGLISAVRTTLRIDPNRLSLVTITILLPLTQIPDSLWSSKFYVISPFWSKLFQQYLTFAFRTCTDTINTCNTLSETIEIYEIILRN